MKKFLPLLSTFLFIGCSVYMAADKTGTDVASVQKCNTRIQFMNLGAKVISSERLPDGNLVEIYQVKAEKSSAVRAIMHGLLDLSTGFGWEFIGTPLELYLIHESNFTLRVTYDSNDALVRADFL
jgi:hypothetical protein